MRLLACVLPVVFLVCPAYGVFTDITQDCGMGSVGGSKLSWGDYNNDGFEDLLVRGRVLFRNDGPPDWTFTDVSDSAGINVSAACGGVWGDYDNDGWLDVYANCCGYGSDILWRNNGDGTFTDVTAAAGNPSDTFPSEGVAWGDYDNDGYIDMYVANYENWDLNISYPDFLWHNLGDGTFSNCTDSAGVTENMRSRGVCWADYDEDSDLDIYVSNYRLMPNHLWDNQGDRTFFQQAFNKGVAGTEFGGYYGHTIGSAWGDLNNDGYMDLFAANLAHKDPPRGPYCDDSYIFINNGPPDFDFTDIRPTSGIEIHPIGSTRDGYYWDELHDGVAFGDYDNDGDLDMCVTQVYDIPFAWSFLWANNGDKTFTDVTEDEGVRVW
ncbi:MAG: FG-GAP repeat domain-containing protein, partial [bacterium]